MQNVAFDFLKNPRGEKPKRDDVFDAVPSRNRVGNLYFYEKKSLRVFCLTADLKIEYFAENLNSEKDSFPSVGGRKSLRNNA